MKNLWNKLDGKKTVIGAVVFFIAVQLQAHGLVDQPTLNNLNGYAELVGGVLTMLGLGHKVVKAVS